MSPGFSPGEDRIGNQRDLVRRIASICTRLVPDDMGVHLRFINAELADANNLRMEDVVKIMDLVEPNGGTKIGTNLRERILNPCVYNQTKLARPLFVSIITDGVPNPETPNTLENEIVRCQEFLETNGLPSRCECGSLIPDMG